MPDYQSDLYVLAAKNNLESAAKAYEKDDLTRFEIVPLIDELERTARELRELVAPKPKPFLSTFPKAA